MNVESAITAVDEMRELGCHIRISECRKCGHVECSIDDGAGGYGFDTGDKWPDAVEAAMRQYTGAFRDILDRLLMERQP